MIVCLDDCSGERANRLLVDEDADDILRAISDRYLAVNCSVMTPNDARIDNTAAMARAYRADGVVEVVLQACHTFNVESSRVQRRMEEEGSRTSSWKPTTLQGTAARWEPGWPRSSRCCSDCRLVGANGDPWQFLERIPLRFLA